MEIRIATHSGQWHSDEIMAIAVMHLVFPGNNISVIRTRDKNLYESCDYVIDVGGKFDNEKYFDHHQNDFCLKRDNGIPYASFGLIWKKFGEKICGSEIIARRIDKRLASFIDAFDVGGGKMSAFFENNISINAICLSDVFANAAGSFLDEKPHKHEDFLWCVEFAKKFLSDFIRTIRDELVAENFVRRTLSMQPDEQIAIFDIGIPYKRYIKAYPNILIWIVPNETEKTYSLYLMNKDKPSFTIPSTWNERPNSSGVKDILYINKNGSQLVTRSRESAITVAKNLIRIFSITNKPPTS